MLGHPGAALPQGLLKPVEFEQAGAQALADQQHQAEGQGTDQAAGQHRDQDSGTPWSQIEQAEASLAHAAAQAIAQGREHPPEGQERRDQQPTGHGDKRGPPVSVRAFS